MVGMNSRVGKESSEMCDVRRWGYQTLVAFPASAVGKL